MTIFLNLTTQNFFAHAQTQSGETKIELSNYIGRKIVLYFYPKDNTPGCTTESIEFNNNLEDFKKANCEIIGISKDSLKKHANFILKNALKFPLIADVDGEICDLFDVIKLKNNFGKEYMGIERSTFLINEKSILTHEWRKVKVKGHIENVLNTVKGTQQ